MKNQMLKIINNGLVVENLGYDQAIDEQPMPESIEMCRKWIKEWIDVRKTINKKSGYGSYSLKHFVEEMRGGDISNGAFIQAAKDEGYKIEPFGPNSPNAHFNMNFTRLDKERKRLQDERDRKYWKEREKESMARMEKN
jgi:hypothetical protein